MWDERTDGSDAYYQLEDQTDTATILGSKVLVANGHMTVSPDGRWILTDEYPDDQGNRPVLLYRLADGWHAEVARVHSPMPEDGTLRCDLHPRWNRDGRQVCIDSIHEGNRHMYVLDVPRIVER